MAGRKKILLRAGVLCLSLLFMPVVAAGAGGDSLRGTIQQHCLICLDRLEQATGSYILEYGEEALMSRAWLTQQARESIDVQYFIWSTDNIGILAGEALLRAAERGVRVRVLVDDLLIDAQDKTLLALAAHPNVQIKIYNPVHSVGVSTLAKLGNVLRDFRGANQRMHDKTAIFDQLIGITGGRNMADEYFDYNGQYNFRDRDVLLMGQAVAAMRENFNQFWNSTLAVSVDDLLSESAERPTPQQVENH